MATYGMAQETKGFYKLSWVQRIGFGAGDLAQNLIYHWVSRGVKGQESDISGLSIWKNHWTKQRARCLISRYYWSIRLNAEPIG